MLDSIIRTLFPEWSGGYYEGFPKGNFSALEQSVIALLLRSSLPDAEFLSIDLESDQSASEIKSLLSPDQWSDLKQFQCHLIRKLRKNAYQEESDCMYFASGFDNAPEDEWRAKVGEIKARFPWPGEYR